MAGQLTAGAVVTDTLKASSGVLATQNGMTGIAKAWVYFSARTGTTVVNNSFNVSSVTYSSTGQFVVNLTTAMPNANYAITTGTSGDIAGARTGYAMVNFQGSTTGEIAPTTSTFAIATQQPSSASYNSYYVYAAVFSS